MLLLTRNVGESIMIGDDIKITITKTQRNQVMVGIDAPKEIGVHRLEIYEKLKLENELS